MKLKSFIAVEHELAAVLPTKFNECPQHGTKTAKLFTRLMKACFPLHFLLLITTLSY